MSFSRSLRDDAEDNESLADNDAARGVTQGDTTKAVVHYRVELPPYFHRDGRRTKKNVELAVRACANGQQLDIARILPTGCH